MGVVFFSVNSGASNESIPDNRGIIQKIEVNDSSFLEERERLEKAGIDPLQFFLINNDSRKHVMSIEIFDFNNKSVFKENYTINSDDEISSPKIDAELGQYRYEIILDNELTYEAKVQAGFVANLGGSEKLHLTIRDNPDNPIQFVGEIS